MSDRIAVMRRRPGRAGRAAAGGLLARRRRPTSPASSARPTSSTPTCSTSPATSAVCLGDRHPARCAWTTVGAHGAGGHRDPARADRAAAGPTSRASGHNAIHGTVAQVVYLGARPGARRRRRGDGSLIVEVPNAAGPTSVTPSARIRGDLRLFATTPFACCTAALPRRARPGGRRRPRSSALLRLDRLLPRAASSPGAGRARARAKPHRDARRPRSESTSGSSSATWIDRPSSSAPNVEREHPASTSPRSRRRPRPDLTASTIIPRQRRVELDPARLHLVVPEGLRPQVEPQPPRAGDLVVRLGDAASTGSAATSRSRSRA